MSLSSHRHQRPACSAMSPVFLFHKPSNGDDRTPTGRNTWHWLVLALLTFPPDTLYRISSFTCPALVSLPCYSWVVKLEKIIWEGYVREAPPCCRAIILLFGQLKWHGVTQSGGEGGTGSGQRSALVSTSETPIHRGAFVWWHLTYVSGDVSISFETYRLYLSTGGFQRLRADLRQWDTEPGWACSRRVMVLSHISVLFDTSQPFENWFH